ncbi:MAG: PBP1A family penicillin-binding protein [Pseudomonadota bacterium]
MNNILFTSKRAAIVRGALYALSAVVLLIAGFAAYVFFAIAPSLPALDVITDYRPKIPLRVYTADHALIGEFGEEHRDFVPIAQMPDLMKKAVIAIEDSRFYEHGGVDWRRAAGAIAHRLGGGRLSGFSTLTMQIPRNFVISREQVWQRKLVEILLAYRIEHALSKDRILELYMNHMYLGQRSYGFASAARTYFNKPLDKLSVAETAMLAGLPQNPAHHNPISNAKRARERQHEVLKRMRELNYIDEPQYQAALREPLHISAKGQSFDTHAEYVAELARQQVYDQFQEEAYTRGIVVTTTILRADQEAAYESVRRNVIAFDQRHGYRGPEAFITLPADEEEREDAIDDALQKRPGSDRLLPAMVLEAGPKLVKVETAAGDNIDISGDGLKFAAAALAANAKKGYKLVPGAVVRIAQDAKKAWSITQVPQVSAAFVSIDADSGAYQALVGGFDFNLQKFNHVTQAWRQPGSGFKPFVYGAALEKGYSPGTMILDEALDMPGEDAGATWSPRNDDNKFDGPITMRAALAHSKNVPSVRLLRAITVAHAHSFASKFGFDPAKQPKNLTLALGTGAVTPLQMAGAYAVFANGGYQVQPYLVSRIVDGNNKVLFEAKPAPPKQESARIIDQRNAFVVDSMLRDVTRYGTGAAATVRLARSDIAGKTGTTSDALDGWFSGYGGNVVAVAWMGYDDPKSLGGREFGATLALPIWIDYMQVALAHRPVVERPVPEGVEQSDGDWMYSEYIGDESVRGIDIDEAKSPVKTEPER